MFFRCYSSARTSRVVFRSENSVRVRSSRLRGRARVCVVVHLPWARARADHCSRSFMQPNVSESGRTDDNDARKPRVSADNHERTVNKARRARNFFPARGPRRCFSSFAILSKQQERTKTRAITSLLVTSQLAGLLVTNEHTHIHVDTRANKMGVL